MLKISGKKINVSYSAKKYPDPDQPETTFPDSTQPENIIKTVRSGDTQGSGCPAGL